MIARKNKVCRIMDQNCSRFSSKSSQQFRSFSIEPAGKLNLRFSLIHRCVGRSINDEIRLDLSYRSFDHLSIEQIQGKAMVSAK